MEVSLFRRNYCNISRNYFYGNNAKLQRNFARSKFSNYAKLRCRNYAKLHLNFAKLKFCQFCVILQSTWNEIISCKWIIYYIGNKKCFIHTPSSLLWRETIKFAKKRWIWIFLCFKMKRFGLDILSCFLHSGFECSLD